MNKSQNEYQTRFSLLDLLLVLILIAAVVGTVFRYDLVDRLFGKKEMVNVNITFVVTTLDNNQINALSADTSFSYQGKAFGTLTSYTESAAKIYEENDEGVLLTRDDPHLRNIQGILTATLEKTDEGYFFNDSFIGAGAEITLKGGALTLNATVISVRPA